MNMSIHYIHQTKSLVPQHSPSTLREHIPPVAVQKGLPAPLERRMLYLAFGYPRGAPPCLSGMFGLSFCWGGSGSCLEIESDEDLK